MVIFLVWIPVLNVVACVWTAHRLGARIQAERIECGFNGPVGLEVAVDVRRGGLGVSPRIELR